MKDGSRRPRRRVADERAIEARKRRPIDVRKSIEFVFISAQHDDDVAAAGVGERDAGVCGRAERRGNAGNDFEWNALLVQEERFLAAAVEDERVTPLESRDELSLAGFFGEQERDRILRGIALGGRADLDLFGVDRRQPQQARRRAIVNDDIGVRQDASAAYADEPRIAGARADENHVSNRIGHGCPVGPK